jgi:hypothetical protein
MAWPDEFYHDTVCEPYLDKVFHVRRALTYWAGNYSEEDSKITSTAGLHVLSHVNSPQTLIKFYVT